MWHFSFKLWPFLLLLSPQKTLVPFILVFFCGPSAQNPWNGKILPPTPVKKLLNYLENKKLAQQEKLQPSFNICILTKVGFKDLVSISNFPKFSAIGVWIIESWTKNRIQNCCRTQNWPCNLDFIGDFVGMGLTLILSFF